MNLNRNRPPPDCPDLEIWFAQTVNDAIRDCAEAGLGHREMTFMLLSLARGEGFQACLSRAEWEEAVRR